MKKAFTLIEIIFSIVIMGISSLVVFKYMETLSDRNSASKVYSDLNLETTNTMNFINNKFSNRISSSVIGYDVVTPKIESIYSNNSSYNILEWIGYCNECFQENLISQFTDLDKSNNVTGNLFSPNSNGALAETFINEKFNIIDSFDNRDAVLIPSGGFDEGSNSNNILNSFGWHGSDNGNIHYSIYNINNFDNTGNITIDRSIDILYEKYYIADSAYSIARGSDINLNANCITNLNLNSIDQNTLFIFYNFRPWKNETFCADKNKLNSENNSGSVSILMNNVIGFATNISNSKLNISISTERFLYKKIKVNITKELSL